MTTKEIVQSLKKNICPYCNSKRINKMNGYVKMNIKKTHYCMNCEREFDSSGKLLTPLY